MAITLRATKGSALTHAELDGNFTDLNTNKLDKVSTSNLEFSGTTLRITGDFSNATVANRLLFQSSSPNSATNVGALPNGTSPQAGFFSFGDPDPDNTSWFGVYIVDGTAARLNSSKLGTGSYLPIQFLTSDSSRMTLDTAGNLGIGVTPYAWSSVTAVDLSTAGGVFGSSTGIGACGNTYYDGSNFRYKLTGEACNLTVTTSGFQVTTATSGTAGNVATLSIAFSIDIDGTASFIKNKFGYGAGAGGSVTQLTSKSTAVTLNKPSGHITMHNGSLSANTTVGFILNNTTIAPAGDTLIVNIHADGVVNPSNYLVWAAPSGVTDGQTTIYVRNISGGALAEAVTLRFNIIKGSIS